MLIGMLRLLQLVIILLSIILIKKPMKGGRKSISIKVIPSVKLDNLKFTSKKFLSKGLMLCKIKDMTPREKGTTKKKLLKLPLLMIILKLLGG
jgi:hypothetical protein